MPFVLSTYEHDERRHHVAATLGRPDELPAALRALAAHARTLPAGEPLLADVYALRSRRRRTSTRLLAGAELPAGVSRASCSSRAPEAAGGAVDVRTFARDGDGELAEDRDRPRHAPDDGRAASTSGGCASSTLERLPSAQDVYLFRAVAHDNPRDERLVALAEVRDLTPVARRVRPHHRAARARADGAPGVRGDAHGPGRAVAARKRLHWNRLLLYAWPPMEFAPGEASEIITPLRAHGAGLGLEMVQLARACARTAWSATARCASSTPPAAASRSSSAIRRPRPLQPLDEGAQRIISARRRGSLHPAEIVKILAPQRAQPGSAIPPGEFVEHDLDDDGRARPGRAPAGHQHARASWSG